jgi:lipoprotein NlpI
MSFESKQFKRLERAGYNRIGARYLAAADARRELVGALLAAAQLGPTGWSGVLARFYRGELDYAAAQAEARTFGQQTELRYYESLNRLAAGDRGGAAELLRQVVETHIFNYFEWQMADRDLVRLGLAP